MHAVPCRRRQAQGSLRILTRLTRAMAQAWQCSRHVDRQHQLRGALTHFHQTTHGVWLSARCAGTGKGPVQASVSVCPPADVPTDAHGRRERMLLALLRCASLPAQGRGRDVLCRPTFQRDHSDYKVGPEAC
eukprot:scaffold25812_cov24-Tisochrysis_lutea.AAC.1